MVHMLVQVMVLRARRPIHGRIVDMYVAMRVFVSVGMDAALWICHGVLREISLKQSHDDPSPCVGDGRKRAAHSGMIIARRADLCQGAAGLAKNGMLRLRAGVDSGGPAGYNAP